MTVNNYELFQKWAAKVKKKPAGYSPSFTDKIKKSGLFSITSATDVDWDSKVDEAKNSHKVDGTEYDGKTIGVHLNAITAYRKFLDYLEENGESSLIDIKLEEPTKNKRKSEIEAEEENREEIAAQLLQKLRDMNPYAFEVLIKDLFVKMGYGECEVTRKSGDGGVDGIISRDALDLEKIVFQAKRYAEDNKVSGDVVQRLAGSLGQFGANYGVLITTGYYQKSAEESAIYNKIRLIDCDELIDLLIKYEIGVRTKRTISIYEVDLNYFDEEVE